MKNGIFFKIVFILLLCFVGNKTNARKGNNSGKIIPGGYLDTVIDGYGNKFSLGQIAINDAIRAKTNGAAYLPLSVPSCSSGYFQLYLDAGCGLENFATDTIHNARLAVLCRVLHDISNFIFSPCTTSGQKINIWVKPSASGSVLGLGSPFFNIAYSPVYTGIADNTAWVTLNSGEDAFTNVSSPLTTSGGASTGATFFHGSIQFNFTGSIDWNTNLSAVPASGQYDLYTVALHEMLHVLGFMSLINFSGGSIFGPNWQYYSRYDMHLVTHDSLHLITNPGDSCTLYQWSFNTGLTPASVLAPGTSGICASAPPDHTDASTAIRYSGSTYQYVYTPTCFKYGGSLSHFEDEYTTYLPSTFTVTPTNNQYFPMSNVAEPGVYNPATNTGAMKRHPTPEERKALSDIGYRLDTVFGGPYSAPIASGYPAGHYFNYYNYGTSILGTQTAGINDGILSGAYRFVTTPGAAISINGGTTGSILDNDYDGIGGLGSHDLHFKCLEVMTGSGTVNHTSGNYSTLVNYTPDSSDFGVQLLRYIPVSSSGAEGNISYIYVYVGDPGCTPTPCDLVANGGFENTDPGSYGESMYGVHCWLTYNGDPALLARDAATLPYPVSVIPNSWFFGYTDVRPYNTVANNHFVILAKGPYWMGLCTSESIQEQLSTDLQPGNSYTISFWAKLADSTGNIGATLPAHLQFAVGSGYPLTGSVYSTVPGLPPGFSSLAVFTITHPDTAWHYYTQSVIFDDSLPLGTLVVQPAALLDSDTSAARYIAIDDISIKPTVSLCSFVLPFSISYNDTPFNLYNYVSIPGGTFDWTAKISGIDTITHDSLFNPTLAYAASITSLDSGTASLCYHYHDSLGCYQTICAETIISCAPYINGPTWVTVGSAITLSDSIPGGFWFCSNLKASISVSGVLTGVSPGIDTIYYRPDSACVASRIVTVNSTVIVKNTFATTNDVRIIPNPNSGSFTIEGTFESNEKEINVKIENIIGQIVYSNIIMIKNRKLGYSICLDHDLPGGLYFLQIADRTQERVVKVVKQ